jgi:hypothetical protein
MSSKPAPSIGDVLRTMAGDPAPARDSTAPPVEGPVTIPQAGVSEDLLLLAEQVAQATDEAREAQAKASVFKAELTEKMKAGQVEQIQLADRPPIKFVTKNERQKTMKALKALKLGEGEEWWTEERAQRVWKALPTVPKRSLDIPPPGVDEPDL